MVGAASRDLVDDDPRGWRLGGAAAYATLTLARLGIGVRALIGVDSLAAESAEIELLRTAGAEVALARLARGPVFENLETPDGRVQRCRSISDPLPVAALPPGWGDAAGVLLLSVAGELDDVWAGVPRPDALVAVGWQGWLRTLQAGAFVRRRRPVSGPVLRRADLVAVSEDDVEPGAAASLGTLLPSRATLIVTSGAGGGSLSHVDRAGARVTTRYRAIPSGTVVDPTGAGDVFLAAMVAARIDASRIGRARGASSDARFAAAAASLAIEAPGLFGVPDLAAVLRRMRRRSRRAASS